MLRDKIKLVEILMTSKNYTRLLSASGRLAVVAERAEDAVQSAWTARRWMFARRWRDVHEVDEAKAVHKVIISSASSMIRKID